MKSAERKVTESRVWGWQKGDWRPGGRHLQSGKKRGGCRDGGLTERDSSVSVLKAWGPAEGIGLGHPVVIIWT